MYNFKFIIKEIKFLIFSKIIYSLHGILGYRLRSKWFRGELAYCGIDIIIDHSVIIIAPEKVRIGNHCRISYGTFLNGTGSIIIGDDVLIGMNVKVITTNHVFDRIDIPIREQGEISKPIIIGNDVWIGANVIILPGISIGNGCIIGAGSIVTRNLPDYSIAVGNPAKIIKIRSGYKKQDN